VKRRHAIDLRGVYVSVVLEKGADGCAICPFNGICES
jgi:hypothetical protein